MLDSNFEPAEKIFWHDKALNKVILRFFPKFILPNHLTAFRFLATPFVVALMAYENYLIGLIAFLLVSFTDALDGSLARIRNQITEWGRICDPLADKVLISSMVFVIVLRYIDFWVAIILVLLELLFVIGAFVKKKHGEKIEANLWGKTKMCLQVLGVAILLLSIVFSWDSLLPIASDVFYLSIAFAIVSLLSHGF